MSVTEEVRAWLDAMGVEWMGTDYTEPTSGHATNTSLGHEHHDAVFAEYVDGTVLRLFDLTPEQAIASTLGRGTCKQEEHGWSTEGDHARVWLTCGHDCMVETVADLPNFCPICGAKVVDA